MKALVIGQGSMGKRRVRCLQHLGIKDIFVYDSRRDRRQEARPTGVVVLDDLQEIPQVDLAVISVSPNAHVEVFEQIKDKAGHFFIEAGTCHLDEMKEKLSPYSDNIYPSYTSFYYNYAKFARRVATEDHIHMYTYHVGQSIEDWHPWESVHDYYVSNPICNGNREIVPYELAWLKKVFGTYTVETSFMDMTGLHNFQMHDIYSFVIRHENGTVGNIIVDGFSRPTITRELRMFSKTKKYEISNNDWEIHEDDDVKSGCMDAGKAQKGYSNPEDPYIEEIRQVLESIQTGSRVYGNSLDDELFAISSLYEIEQKAKIDIYVKLDHS